MSIRKKLVIGISGLAVITYGCSAFFIFVLADLQESFLGLSKNTFIVITLLKGIFWSGVLGWFFAPLITKPLKDVEESVHKAAVGDIRHDIKVKKSDDEIRALGLAFNEMLASLRSMVKDIDEHFNVTNERVKEMTAASELAATKAEQIGYTMDEIAKGAENSANAIQNTAESIEEVTSIAEQVQQKATASKQLSEEMVHTLHESRVAVEELVTGINELASENEKSLTSVGRLEEQAKKVGEIISLVGDIAEQTNLLALNASIEAARAGEQGKGFAVVADEVRKLADESAQAVQGITELIHRIQAEVQHVVAQISEQVKAAMRQAERGANTSKAIVAMEQSVHEVAAEITSIAQMIDRQMEAIQKTSQESQEVAAIAEETSAGALEVSAMTEQQVNAIQEVASRAKQLTEQARKLKETINKFTIE